VDKPPCPRKESRKDGEMNDNPSGVGCDENLEEESDVFDARHLETTITVDKVVDYEPACHVEGGVNVVIFRMVGVSTLWLRGPEVIYCM
jgi:hypothetical protein